MQWQSDDPWTVDDVLAYGESQTSWVDDDAQTTSKMLRDRIKDLEGITLSQASNIEELEGLVRTQQNKIQELKSTMQALMV